MRVRTCPLRRSSIASKGWTATRHCLLWRANSILILLHKNWIAYFEARAAYNEDPSRFTGRPKLPKYKDKVKGRNILIYDTQALGKRHFKQTGNLLPSGLPLEIATCVTEWRQVAQVRIVPRLDGYMIEVVYEQQEEQAEVDPQLVAALDPGVTVLAALTSNKPGFVPRLVSGKPLKSLNQFYNKQRAAHQSRLSHEHRFTSPHLDRITSDAQSPGRQLSAHGQPSHHRSVGEPRASVPS